MAHAQKQRGFKLKALLYPFHNQTLKPGRFQAGVELALLRYLEGRLPGRRHRAAARLRAAAELAAAAAELAAAVARHQLGEKTRRPRIRCKSVDI